MWAAAVVVLCLAFASGVRANWQEGEGDNSMGNLGFYTEFMECDTSNERCVHCFQEKSNGEVYMHTFEFTLNPVKFQINMFMGKLDRKLYLIRDDPTKLFRLCFEHDWTPAEGDDFKVNICMDNNFAAMTVPEECSNPIAVVSFDYHHTDDKIHGQQILYCLPNVPE